MKHVASFQLSEIITQDNLIHQGVYFQPTKKTNTAILWIHGLSGTFYGNMTLLNEFSHECEKYGYGFASFNNRGHDLITGIRKLDIKNPKGYTHINGGAGYEEFKDSFYDIDAGVDFLVTKGYKNVVLIGHSTGALKACYFAGKSKNKNLFGVILSGFVSDRLDPSMNQKNIQKTLKSILLKKLDTNNEKLLLGKHFFPLTPKRYISLFAPYTLEDQADYGEAKPKLAYFRNIKKPLFVILGENDEYLDRPAKEVLKILDSSHNSTCYKSHIINNALHSFNGQEKEYVSTIISWIQSI